MNPRIWRRMGYVLDHIDGDPRNNDLANLRVVHIQENRRWADGLTITAVLIDETLSPGTEPPAK